MPDSGINLGPSHHHGQQPPFYSPPAPPPPHHHHQLLEDGGYHHMAYNNGDDNNGNRINGPEGGNYSRASNNNGGGGRSVSFGNPSGNNNPNDPNNNQGMMMMLEEDGGGGGGPPNGDQGLGGDMMIRDLFEEIRNGGGHWSQLLRQVVLSPPSPPVLSTPQQNSNSVLLEGEDYSSNNNAKDDLMLGDSGGEASNSNNNNSGGENTNTGNNTFSSQTGDQDDSPSGTSSTSHVVPLQIVGGSENGQFVYVGITNQDINRWITVGYLQPGDIILEIQGQQVAGYTQADVISLLHHCLRGNSATLTVAPRGSLGPELRSYLNTRFQKGSVDHALQGVVRDNLYLRTVPVTTRSPRPGEINGVDYTFLSVEEFMQLERDGSLLESGVYAGNHYGTPKPWARLTRGVIGGGEVGGMDQYGGGASVDALMQHNNMIAMMEGGGSMGGAGGQGKGPLLPGMHPSSEGKRRRNRSNVEALGAGGDDDGHGGAPSLPQIPPGTGGGGDNSPGGVELGPLPANWEMAYTDNGEVYFIDHNTGTSHWLDPRLSRVQKLSLEDCTEDELPFGWERIEDPHYGVYYIDHVNRRTQFENPVIQAKQQAQHGQKGPNNNSVDRNGNNGGMSTDSEADSTSKFLPAEHHHSHLQPPPMQYPPQPHQYLASQQHKRPTSLAKPIPPVPNPKPQNPNRLSISQQQQQQRTKTQVNELGEHFNDNGALPAFPSSSSAGSSSGGLRVKPVLQDMHNNQRPSFHRFFTRDPTQLIGERITTTLVKSSRGLGFTIVGGDDDDGLDEFLQIKSVVADGPAWNDGKLRTGDVLVKVNGTCVLGYTHQEMVSIFQSISPGQDVQLEVCRGYPLPFDPADPNTEIVTTVAVAPVDDRGDPQKKHVDWARPGTPDSLTHSAHSLPELSNNDRLTDFGVVDRGKLGGGGNHRPASVDLLLDSPKGHVRYPGGMFLSGGHHPHNGPEGSAAVLTVNIVKGAQGFGFTIADSVTGQKVKKVLDSGHCGELEEGDRLIALDGLDLRGLSHTQVVQILKDFPVGREACLTIQRTPPNSPYNGNGGGESNNNVGNNAAARFFSGSGGGSYLPPPTRQTGISPRSKTPTAELARGRPRLRDNLPERPKTPQGMLGVDGGSRGDYNGLFNGDMFGHHQFLSGGSNSNEAGGRTNMGDLNSLPVQVREWVEMSIELQRRQEGFGFRIVGGTEEGSQVSVGHIVPGGAAALDGRLNTGDQLMAVDGISVVGASHRSVVQLMARSATQGKVGLTVRRPVYGGNTPQQDLVAGGNVVVTPIHSPGGGGGSIAGASVGSGTSGAPIHVTLRRQPSEGFGFVIISSASKAGATIGKIVDGSPADRCGELRVGDRILAVNNLDISQLHHTQVVQLIKESGFVLTLSVLPVVHSQLPQTPTTPTGSGMGMHTALGMGSPQQGGLQQQMHHSVSGGLVQDGMENLSLKDGSQTGDMGTSFISPEGIHFGMSNSHSAASPGYSTDGGQDQVFSVHLNRGNRGFGFSIRGGKEFQNMPLFVLRLAEDGPAAMDGRMLVGDQILQINGINTHGMTHAQAIHLIKTGGASVHLLLRRGSVPFPFLNQMPNLSGGGFVGSNGQEMEEQSLSNASNNNSTADQQFISQSQNAAHLYRDHHHHAGF